MIIFVLNTTLAAQKINKSGEYDKRLSAALFYLRFGL